MRISAAAVSVAAFATALLWLRKRKVAVVPAATQRWSEDCVDAMPLVGKTIRRVVVLFAMRQEASPFVEQHGFVRVAWGARGAKQFRAFRGTVGSTDVVLVWAGSNRFGGNAVGTVPSAVSCYASVLEFEPHLVISAGTAGGFRALGGAVGDVYLGSKCVFHDRRIPEAGSSESETASPPYEEYGFGQFRAPPLGALAAAAGLKRGVVSTSDSLDCTARDIELMASEVRAPAPWRPRACGCPPPRSSFLHPAHPSPIRRCRPPTAARRAFAGRGRERDGSSGNRVGVQAARRALRRAEGNHRCGRRLGRRAHRDAVLCKLGNRECASSAEAHGGVGAAWGLHAGVVAVARRGRRCVTLRTQRERASCIVKRRAWRVLLVLIVRTPRHLTQQRPASLVRTCRLEQLRLLLRADHNNRPTLKHRSQALRPRASVFVPSAGRWTAGVA